MNEINKLKNIFNKYLCYDEVNKFSDKMLRNNKNGIDIKDIVIYRLKYTNISNTKQEIVSQINCLNTKNISRQAYDKKDNNIPIKFYINILNEINMISNNTFYNNISSNNIQTENLQYNDSLIEDLKMYSVDGIYGNDKNRNTVLNLGLYDNINDIPIDIKFCGTENRNKEVKVFIEYIKENMHIFKNCIIVADRLYFNYSLLNFLNENKLKYIIRVKGSGSNLEKNAIINKHLKNFDQINSIKNNVRLVKFKDTINKTIYNGRSKKRAINKKSIEVRNDCILVTNLPINEKYTDEKILENYRSRWSIEVFFKLIKNNFKFQNMNEKNIDQYKKMHICELIMIHIANILETYFWKTKKKKYTINKKNKKKVQCTCKINKSNLIRGINDSFLYDLIYSKINKCKVNNFINNYIVIIKNEINRSFPRNSKTPFTKWYIKGYSELTKYSKIINSIKNGTIDQLNKNLKMIANKIVSISQIK